MIALRVSDLAAKRGHWPTLCIARAAMGDAAGARAVSDEYGLSAVLGALGVADLDRATCERMTLELHRRGY